MLMTDFPYGTALIVGAGPGISASLARQLSARGVKVALAARSVDKLKGVANDTGAKVFSADAAQPVSVAALFDDVADAMGDPDVVIYNASGRVRGPLTELDPVEVQQAIAVSAFGGFLVCQQAARRMIPRGRGAILFKAPRQASRDFPNRRRSRWASSRFAALPKVRRANSGRMEFTSRISSSTAPFDPRCERKIPTSLTACSIRMRSHKATSTSCCSTEAHGRTRSS
jgi:NAD(P)-dependent dehydrogenase (short-subunit alcohol dehydrogenase family)